MLIIILGGEDHEGELVSLVYGWVFLVAFYQLLIAEHLFELTREVRLLLLQDLLLQDRDLLLLLEA
jgi:hypothetical protein